MAKSKRPKARRPKPEKRGRQKADKKPTPGRQGGKRINWLKLEREYLSNESISLSDIAVRHKVNVSQVRERAAADGWAEKRERVFKALSEKLPDAVIGDLKAEQDRATAVIKSVGHRLIKLIDKQARIYDEVGLFQSDTLRNLAGAYKSAAETLRLSLGMSTVITEPPETLKIERKPD